MACFSSQHGLPTGIASCPALGDAVALHAAIGNREGYSSPWRWNFQDPALHPVLMGPNSGSVWWR